MACICPYAHHSPCLLYVLRRQAEAGTGRGRQLRLLHSLCSVPGMQVWHDPMFSFDAKLQGYFMHRMLCMCRLVHGVSCMGHARGAGTDLPDPLRTNCNLNTNAPTLQRTSCVCRVIAWEPVPHFRAFSEAAIMVNNVSHLVELRPKVVSARDEMEVKMQVGRSAIGKEGAG